MQTQQLAANIDETFTALKNILNNTNDALLNRVPFEGSWTAGQVLQHIIFSGKGFVEIINGPTSQTTRMPDEKAAPIESLLLNFSTKMESPPFVVPPQKGYEKEALLNDLKMVEDGIHQALAMEDLSLTCLAFELPVYGFLTRYESLTFIAAHSKRHLRQVNNVLTKAAAL